MSQIGDTWQVSTDGILQHSLGVIGTEWLARHDEGQRCEMWVINGGPYERWGLNLLWVPEERVALVATRDYYDDGPVLRWWGNVNHPRDFEHFFTPLRPPLVELPYYVPHYKQWCEFCCEGPIDAAARERSGRLAAFLGDAYHFAVLCDACYPEYLESLLRGFYAGTL
jgi:hypothetical protein